LSETVSHWVADIFAAPTTFPQIGFVEEAVAALKVIGSDHGNGSPIIATPEKCHLFSKLFPHEVLNPWIK
jgi:hypothetical protein